MYQFEYIETPRLLLKGISHVVMQSIFESLPRNEIKILLGHRTEEAYLAEEYKHLNGYSSYNRRFLLFLLIDKASDTVIGRCGIHNWNADNHRAEIGYVMHDEAFKSRGLMSEALEAVIVYGFEKLRLNRLEALVGASNGPSLRLLEKNRFLQEGILRQHIFLEDHFEDSILFSRLKGE